MRGRKFVVYLGTGYFCKWTVVQSLPLEKLEGITYLASVLVLPSSLSKFK